jgi:hypothetical protein
MTTKILALADALGNLVRFILLPGQRYDTVGVPPLIEGIVFDALIGDKAFDSNWVFTALDARGAKAVISQHPRRLIGKLKEFKRIAQRADKTESELCCQHLPCRRCHPLTMNLNRP